MKAEQIIIAALVGVLLCKLFTPEGYMMKKEKYRQCGCGA
jgi:hypothetical protein